MAYALTLTAQDMRTIEFVGNCYGWSAALLDRCSEGQNILSEPDAWKLQEAFISDTVGDHAPFPMLDTRSDLYSKLISFWEEIV